MRLSEKGGTAGVAGMGLSGYAAARLLTKVGYTVVGFDSSPQAVASEHTAKTVFGDFSDSDLRNLSVLVVSPGVPLSSEIVSRALALGVPVTGEIELALKRTGADILAVTGSNGKTTTVEWLARVIRLSGENGDAVVAGNTGYAFSDAVLDHPECSLFVLELSSYQLETTKSLHASAASILNLTPDHLARHGTMKNYADAKARIFLNQKGSDTAVLNYDDPLLTPYRGLSGGIQMYFSLKDEVPAGAWMDSSGMLFYKNADGFTEEVIHSSELALPGKHNVANALAVITMAASYGIPVRKLAAGLRDFAGVAHRMEFLGEAAGLLWYNDSKSTNTDSLRAALETFDTKIVLVAGGKQKESDYSVLAPLIRKKVKGIVVFGSGGAFLAEQWKDTIDIAVVGNLDEAVSTAMLVAGRGDTILFSPGCASFDQYRNFEERGEHFRRIVEELK